jgi:hypothetical protein
MMVVMMVGEYYGDCDGYWWLMMMVIAIVDGDNAYDITTTAVMFSECFSCVRHCAMSSPCIISLNPNTTNGKVLITATEIKGGPTTSVKKNYIKKGPGIFHCSEKVLTHHSWFSSIHGQGPGSRH